MNLKPENIPFPMTVRDQWVLWKLVVENGKPDKKPHQLNGKYAKVNDPSTWSAFAEAVKQYEAGGYSGIGYMFSDDDGLCGVDLDGCRNPDTGAVAPWAREIILKLDTYAEVSPTQTGVKLFVIGKNPFGTGRKIEVDYPRMSDKKPAVEIYDRVRYFAVTGFRLNGPVDPQPRDLTWLRDQLEPNQALPSPIVDWHSEDAVVNRARLYLAKLPPAIAGSGGHNACFRAACVLVIEFGLPENIALALLREYNQTCQPPWSERELLHKVQSASKQPGPRNRLRNERPEKWISYTLPNYEAPEPSANVVITELSSSARKYVERLKSGTLKIEELGLPDVDYSIGGGIEPGEIVVIGARPSHGKSAVALQIVHQWTGDGKPCLIVSEEMSHLALGRRTLQYITDVPMEHWRTSANQLEDAIAAYEERSAAAYIAESCGTAEEACLQMERAVEQYGVELVVVDYAQLLNAPGRGEYEQVTNACKMLRRTVRSLGITSVFLCQLSRAIEDRPKFIPKMSDLKSSGQWEQDADVILFLVWPHRIDSRQDAKQYMIYVAKNRNRDILQPVVTCRFNPSRQTIMVERPLERAAKMQNFSQALADWSNEQEDF